MAPPDFKAQARAFLTGIGHELTPADFVPEGSLLVNMTIIKLQQMYAAGVKVGEQLERDRVAEGTDRVIARLDELHDQDERRQRAAELAS